MGFLSHKHVRVLTVFLLVQAASYYALARTEPVRVVRPLTEFPQQFADWRMVQEGTIEKEVAEILQADQIITRWYGSEKERQVVSLFVAHFTTQRTGKTPHSPKNCLPGSGWSPLVSDTVFIDIPGHKDAVEANRYVVARGEDKSIVIYWYQTPHRTVASEYKAKIYTVLDSLRYNRSDTAIVKVTLTVRNNDVEASTELAKRFIRTFFDQLPPYFPA